MNFIVAMLIAIPALAAPSATPEQCRSALPKFAESLERLEQAARRDLTAHSQGQVSMNIETQAEIESRLKQLKVSIDNLKASIDEQHEKIEKLKENEKKLSPIWNPIDSWNNFRAEIDAFEQITYAEENYLKMISQERELRKQLDGARYKGTLLQSKAKKKIEQSRKHQLALDETATALRRRFEILCTIPHGISLEDPNSETSNPDSKLPSGGR